MPTDEEYWKLWGKEPGDAFLEHKKYKGFEMNQEFWETLLGMYGRGWLDTMVRYIPYFIAQNILDN